MIRDTMDGKGNMNFRNWGVIEPRTSNIKDDLGLQLITSMSEKPLIGDGFRGHQLVHPSPFISSINGGPFHHHRVAGVSESHIAVDYHWMNQSRDKYLNVMPGNHQPAYYQLSYGAAHSFQLPQLFNSQKNESVMSEKEEVCDDGGGSSGVAVAKREKKARNRTHRVPKDEAAPPPNRIRTPKKRAEISINGMNMDISDIPIPICSCTGTPHQCYRWGSGGWQSACCTTGLSKYPLPMSSKRRGARIAGRKMSIGAFKKVLDKLGSEDYDFSIPIDLRSHWAKHGTNKFVTIR